MSDSSLINNTPAGRNERQAAFPWLRHYQEGVPSSLTIPDHPLTWLLDTTTQRFPQNTALIYYGTRLTYAQLSNLANRFAIGLQRLGVTKGDRVAIALPNIPQYPIAFFGALRAGAIVVPTNPLYKQHEMQHQLADSGAKVIVMLDTFYPVVKAVREQTSIEHVIITNPADYLPPILRVLYPLAQRREKDAVLPPPRKEVLRDPGVHEMRTMLQTRNRGGVEVFNLPVATSPDDIAVLQYTGGTTGLAKGAMLTHRNLLANAMQTRYWVANLREGQEVSFSASPFFHSYGMTVSLNYSVLIGAAMVLIPRFKVVDVLKQIVRYRPTLFPGIPTMYIAILREIEKSKRKVDISSIKCCISGASALPAQVQKEFEAVTGGKLVEGYGLSEASPVTHCNPVSEACRNGSIGLPLPEVEAAIMDSATGELLPVGEIGELVVKGPNVMKGYWNREEETEAAFRNGWLRTGDIAKMDEDGYFYIVDRAKDIIIASGFNVYPRDVEEVLFKHPAVAEAAVVGATDSYRGETVAAFVVLKPDHPANDETKQDIRKFCHQNMAPYKVPKIIHFRKSLPKSLVGKVLRRELRAMTSNA